MGRSIAREDGGDSALSAPAPIALRKKLSPPLLLFLKGLSERGLLSRLLFLSPSSIGASGAWSTPPRYVGLVLGEKVTADGDWLLPRDGTC